MWIRREDRTLGNMASDSSVMGDEVRAIWETQSRAPWWDTGNGFLILQTGFCLQLPLEVKQITVS